MNLVINLPEVMKMKRKASMAKSYQEPTRSDILENGNKIFLELSEEKEKEVYLKTFEIPVSLEHYHVSK